MNPLARARFVLSRDQTLGTIAERLAAIHGDRRLVAEPGGHERTYRQASVQVSEWAGGIAARIEPGASPRRHSESRVVAKRLPGRSSK